MLEDYFTGNIKLIAIFLILKDEINILREKLKLPLYSDEEFKKEFRKKVIKLGQVCDRELDNPKLAPAMIKEIEEIKSGK